MTTVKLLTILARHDDTQYVSAHEKIKAILARTCPSAKCRTLIVDTALDASFEAELDGTTRLIGGDNRAREFSGWDLAIQRLGREIERYDVVHLATAPFDQLYSRHIARFDDAMLELVAGRSIAVGHVDYYPYPIASFAEVSQHWLRSSYLFLPPHELRMLGPLAAVDRAAIFSGAPEAPFSDRAPISPGYRKLILSWLTSEEGTGQGVAWHSRFRLDAKTLKLFEDKTVAILNEHMLSIRLRAQGCRTVDVTWLSTVMKGTGIFFAKIPGWRSQLAGRDTDACEPPRAERMLDLRISFK
jgi:hypothetical protein